MKELFFISLVVKGTIISLCIEYSKHELMFANYCA